jgi:hypothetical protein
MSKTYKELFLYLKSSFNYDEFVLPRDPRFMINKNYRTLRDEYLKQKDFMDKSASLIPQIEEELRPKRHHLAMLQLKESELRPLDIKICEADVQEQIEQEVVEKYRREKVFFRERMAYKRALKIQEELQKRMQVEKRESEVKEQVLKKKRKELMSMLRIEIHQVSQ